MISSLWSTPPAPTDSGATDDAGHHGGGDSSNSGSSSNISAALSSARHNILHLDAATSFLDLEDFVDDSGKYNPQAVPALGPSGPRLQGKPAFQRKHFLPRPVILRKGDDMQPSVPILGPSLR